MRILFVTASRIGDAVLSTGLLAHLAEHYPQARFTVACGAPAAPLFAAAPFVDEVIPMVKRKRAGHWMDLWKRTVTRPWSLVVDLRGSAIGWLLPTLRRRGLKSSWEPKHRLVHLASALGLDQALPPKLWATDAQCSEAARLIPPGGPVLAIGPTANWGAKQWPAESFAQVIAALTSADSILPQARVAVFASADERAKAAPVLDSVAPERLIDLAGGIDLPTAYACLRRCAFYLGNDSGLMHMAAAAGIPTLGLFGPSSEVFYGPFGPHAASVRGPRSFEDICHAPDYDYRSQDCMMRDLSPQRVIEAARSLWTRTKGCATPRLSTERVAP
ncbi:glycosyltransferase family 9 protein [Paramagnetospirillum kuznetsovii]|uniref:Glycosyltransferase family 9 protein n=1 Tax=Paramagnetospirillum kuznetsovii TaxID=2053833 RepID=A0A364NXR4_9PROT|nr:glycosyltransferase family 9 protein [Paramagnetospirillum kuznetsovii]RAU21869.1 glycosyltransferase family 9 protein [Paramagnetospirillum kuznetsovii]